MHSYEERMRAVALYIKFGKRVQATIRELGYPTKNTLRGWYREYERCQDLSIGSAPRPPKLSEAQKQAALEHNASHGRGISWTMRALGYPGRATLPAWLRASEAINIAFSAAISSIRSAVFDMVCSYQTSTEDASAKHRMSHPAAGLNLSFHRFGCLRRNGPNPSPVQTCKQRLELCMVHQHQTVLYGRPGKGMLLQLLLGHHQTGAIPIQQLQTIRLPSPEHEDRSGELVLAQFVLHHRRETVVTLAEVDGLGRHHDPHPV